MHGNPAHNLHSARTGPSPEILLPEPEETDSASNIGEAQKVSLATGVHPRLFALFINALVVGELFIAMYWASRVPDQLTPVFFKIFFSLLVPTLVLAAAGRRFFAKTGR